jgi:hypothetical protein
MAASVELRTPAQLVELILLGRGNQRFIVINLLGIYKLEGDGRSDR